MQNEGSFSGVFSVVKGVLFALAIGFVLALLFACILRYTAIPHSAVYPVNQGIKTVAIAVGGLLFVRGEKGWLKGGAIGLLFTMLSYLAFSAIGGDFSLSWLIFAELSLGLVSGSLCGIIAVNMRR